MRCRLISSCFSFAHSPALSVRGLLCLGFTLSLGFLLFAANSPSLVRLSFAIPLLSSDVFPEVLIPTFRVFFCVRFLITSALSLLRRCYFLLAVTSSLSDRRHLVSASSSSVIRGFILGFSAVLALISLSSAFRLFPLDRSPLGSLSRLLPSFYPFGVFRRFHLLPLAFALALLFLEFFSSSRLISLRCYFFVCAVSPAGFYAPHVLSPSLCHLAEPDFLRVLALPLLHSSAPPFRWALAFPLLEA